MTPPPATTVDPSALRRHALPSRASSTDSAVSRDEHAMLHRKLRGLRSKGPTVLSRNQSDEYVNYTPKVPSDSYRGVQVRDDNDKMGSNRSIKTQESATSAVSAVSGSSSAAGSFTEVCYTPDGKLISDVKGSRGVSIAAQDSSSYLASDSIGEAQELSPRPRASHSRGLARRGRTSQTSLSLINSSSHHNQSTKSAMTDTSEHSISTASNISIMGNNPPARGRARGLQAARGQVSCMRVVEPTMAPIVSTMGTASPLVTNSSPNLPRRPTAGSGNSHASLSSAAAASPNSNNNNGPMARRSAATMSTPIPRPGFLDDPDNDMNTLEHDDRRGSAHSQHYSNNNVNVNSSSHHAPHSPRGMSHHQVISTRSAIPAPVSRMGSVTSNSGAATGLRGRREASQSQFTSSSSHHSTSAGTSSRTAIIQEAQQVIYQQTQQQLHQAQQQQPTQAPGPAPVQVPQQARGAQPTSALTPAQAPAQTQTQAQEQEPLYQPTERDWAVLYNKHVQELERKDLEIAMKLSAKRAQEAQEDALDGVNIALEASRREVTQTQDEEEMMQLAMQMSTLNENNQESFANGSFSNLDNVAEEESHNNTRNHHHGDDDDPMLHMAYPSQHAKEPGSSAADTPPTSESELQRALRLSAQPSQRTLTEEEELQRVLRLSEQEAAQRQPAAAADDDEDEELMRVLRMSQEQHEQEQQQSQPRESTEEAELLRILELSQQEATDVEKERETMELVLRLSQMGEL